MNHRIGRAVFALLVGLLVAFFSYRWITNPVPRMERALEEQVVGESRSLIRSVVGTAALEIVDPLSPNRRVGKVYVYAEGPGWAVSGYYRRNDDDSWHPYLLTLTSEFELAHLKVKDAALRNRTFDDIDGSIVEILP